MIRAIALACLITTTAAAEAPRVEMVHGDRLLTTTPTEGE